MGENVVSAVRRLAPRVPGDLFRGPRTVALGDSITIGSNPDGWRHAYNSWFTWLAILSGGRIQPVYNAGVSGETLTQMVARFEADVAAHNPARCILLGGTNDTGNGVALATSMAQIALFVAKCRARKIEPILCTIPPATTGAGTRHNAIANLNAAIAHYAIRNGITLIDFHSALVDESSGDYRSGAGLNVDTIHPNGAGAKAMGVVAWAALENSLPYAVTPLAHHTADAANLITNGLFLNDSNADGRADNWSVAGTATFAIETDAAILGSWQKHTQASSFAYLTQNTTAGIITAGDVIAFSGRVEIITAPSDAAVTARLKFMSASPTTISQIEGCNGLNQTFTGGLFYAEKAAPSGISYLAPELVVSGTGTVARWSQITVHNLTALGIA